jgi:hypothetical protein
VTALLDATAIHGPASDRLRNRCLMELV